MSGDNSSKFIFEVCVDSLESAEAAWRGGAHRVELCSALSKGGLTPSSGLLIAVKNIINIPVYCMVRPHAGPMIYSSSDEAVIIEDVRALIRDGADGLVFGALNMYGEIDVQLCSRFMMEVNNRVPCTFHRAFDLLVDPMKGLQDVITLNFKRILTSGCQKTAMEGVNLIKELVDAAKGSVVIMAGAGVASHNVEELIRNTGVREVHGSAKTSKTFTQSTISMGSDDDNTVWVTSLPEVQNIIFKLQNLTF